jgi:hypothetical protein
MILLTTQHIILLLSNLKCLILQYKIRYTQNNMRHYTKKNKKNKKKKNLKGLSYLLCIVRRNTMDLESVLTILFFIALNNCLESEGKIIFSRKSNYYL